MRRRPARPAPASPATYAATYTDAGPTDLVGAWGFNETGGSLAYDNSGNGLNAQRPNQASDDVYGVKTLLAYLKDQRLVPQP